MSENLNDSVEPLQLSDDDLSQVAGGSFTWSAAKEAGYYEDYQRRFAEGKTQAATFEDYLTENRYFVDKLARDAWIADGRSPSALYTVYSDGRLVIS